MINKTLVGDILRFIRKKWLTIVSGMLTAMLLISLSVYLYAQQSTMPRGLVISNWKAGGLTYSEFRKQWTTQLAGLNERPVLVTSSASGTSNVTLKLKQLGFHVENREISAIIPRLSEGSILDRARQRFRLSGQFIELKGLFDVKIVQQTVDRQWSDLQQQQPQPAVRRIAAGDQVVYEQEKNVSRVDVERLVVLLEEQTKGLLLKGDSDESISITVKLPLRIIKPSVTLESLQAEGISRKIAEFTTYYATSGAGRVFNIQSTAQTIHDMILQPDEVFDYYKVIQATRRQFGFKPAPVILNGQMVPGIGGGICQVSTTLYNTVLRSGLEVVERRHHSLPIRYVPKGQDATFAEGHINFKFRNNSGSSLLIRAFTSGRQITVKLFGSLPEHVTYEIKSNMVKVLQPGIKYMKSSTLPIGGQKVIRVGKQGYIVDTIRIKKENGVAVSTEKISRDTYKASPAIIAVHPSRLNRGGILSKPEEIPGERFIIEDGVGSESGADTGDSTPRH
ncbi:MAG TPA: VanW family protein [Bacilli bacterium]